MSYLTSRLNTIGYNVTVRELSKKLIFPYLSLFLVSYVITYYFTSQASLSGFTSLHAVHYDHARSTSITGHLPFSMHGIVVGCQYIVSSVNIYNMNM